MARRRFFVESIASGQALATGATALHLARVLRARVGQEYELAHAGRVYFGRILQVSPHEVGFEILEELPQPESGPPLELAAALFKFDHFEWMLEKATELGVARLHLLATRRTEPRLLAAAGKRLERWRVMVREAAEQSRRATLPEIVPPLPLGAFLAAPPPGARILLSEDPAAPPLPEPPAAAVLLTGPEGGFAPEEFEAAAAAGFASATLGPRVLRCETAILAALARLG